MKNRYYQQGGEMEQLMQLFQAFADTVQDDEFSTAEEVMQMFQQLSPEEQQAFVQQAMQIVQQAPQEEQMELEEESTMQRGGYVNNTGYSEGYETSKNPYNIIPSKNITMKGVDPKIKYIKGTDNLGNTQYMEHGGEYEFEGDFVIEEPVYAQTGKGIKNIDSKYITFNDGSKLELKTYERDYVNKLKELNTKSFNTDKRREVSETVKLVNDYVSKVKPKTKVETKPLKKTELYSPETGILEDVVNDFGEPFGYKYDKNYFNKKTPIVKQTIPTGMELTETIDGKAYYKDKLGRRFTTDKSNKLIMIEDVKDTSLKQDKPKVTLPPKKVNKAIAKQVATPEVLPPPVPTEIPEMVDNNYQFEIPVMDVSNYYVPEENRTVELNPNAFNRTNVGVGKRFFKQYGGYVAPEFKDIDLGLSPRLQGNDAYVGARSNQQRYDNFNTRTKLFPKLSSLEPINQYDTIPMGAVSANYQAPNEQSRSMFEGRGSNELLDLGNYASRFGEKNLGLGTQPVQNVERKSKFQEFMDKYGKKSDLSFDSNQSNLASAYNLMKASEPLANQYRANVDLKYAETPMLDPLPIVQELYNQQKLATQNVNTNSTTGQAYLSNINAQTQQKTVELLNDVQQKNAQISAQNEQARIAAYNQEQQLNIAANQQYLQNQMLAQAQKDEIMGSALNDIDKIRNQRTKTKNDFNSLAAITPGLRKSTNLRNLVTGEQGFEIDPKYAQLQYYNAQYKTPQQVEAEQKAKVAKQTGGSINQFLKRRIS